MAQAGVAGSTTAVQWTRHALSRLDDYALNKQEVIAALINGEVIEEYPAETRPLPDCLALAILASHDPVHVVIGLDRDQRRILIITVYRPSPDQWKRDWKTRL